MKRGLAIVAALLMCVAIAAISSYDKPGAGSNAVETPAGAASPVPRKPTIYGVNLTTLSYWGKERAFMNLLAGGTWRAAGRGPWTDFDPARINQESTILSLLPGEQAVLPMTRPPASYTGDVPIRCTFAGQGRVTAFGGDAVSVTPGRLGFVWKRDQIAASFLISATDPADPIRHIDCREAGADPKALFDPAFIDSLRPYKVVRLLDWQQANVNQGGNWARRALPKSIVQGGPEGVAVEHLVALSNIAGVDPWFVMPWNADATYMENFARYVHDHLDPKRTAYVEIGNEVWNRTFPVGRQLLAESRKRRDEKDENVARMHIYAEHSVANFKIWERVYRDTPQRLVRILAGQHGWPDLILSALDYRDTVSHVDALASAPYFAHTLLNPPPADTADLGPLFRAMGESLASTFDAARRFQAMADRRGLRYLAYEAGQHITYSGPDKTLVPRLNRDPRMGEIYRHFLAGWDREFGDVIMMFASVSPAGQTAAFGLAEYSGQPLSETPKRQAVLDAIAAGRKTQ